jgi:hypothetical protein
MSKIYSYLLVKIRRLLFLNPHVEAPAEVEYFTTDCVDEHNDGGFRELTLSVVVRQLSNGVHYEGEVKIAEAEFSYDLFLRTPFKLWGNPLTVEDYRQVMKITLRKDGEVVELNDDELAFFAPLVSGNALLFYDSFVVRLKNKKNQQPGPITTDSSKYSFSEELCQKLSQPKFGCRFVA